MAVIHTKALSTHTRGWTDLDLDFTKHPITKDVSRVKDVAAVKRSLKHLLLINKYDKFFHPEVDGGITKYLFALATAHTKHDIKMAIFECIRNYEPRVVVDRVNVQGSGESFGRESGHVSVTGDIDRNGFHVSIYFRIVNSPEPIEVSLFLERLR
jgi:phage baseplate assembly protein W